MTLLRIKSYLGLDVMLAKGAVELDRLTGRGPLVGQARGEERRRPGATGEHDRTAIAIRAACGGGIGPKELDVPAPRLLPKCWLYQSETGETATAAAKRASTVGSQQAMNPP